MIREIRWTIVLFFIAQKYFSTAKIIEYAEKVQLSRSPGYSQACKNGETWIVRRQGNFDICNIENNAENCTIAFPINVTAIHQTQFEIGLSVWNKCKRNATFSVQVDGKTAKKVLIPGVPYDGSAIKTVRKNVSVEVNGKEARLEFSSKGFCGSVDEVLMYYYRCPGKSSTLATYQPINVPSKKTGVIKSDGKCVEHATLGSEQHPVRNCYFDRTVEFLGQCICDAGYTRNGDGTACAQCSTKEYKPNAGNEPCMKCGNNSKSDEDVTRLKCQCKPDFYRASSKTDDYSTNCYQSPSVPGNVTVVTNVTVTIAWSPPKIKGSAELGEYHIWCVNCPSNYRINKNITERKLELNNLGCFAVYRVSIYNENSITRLTGKRHVAHVEFTTKEGQPGKIRDVKILASSNGTVSFSWTAPFARGGSNTKYVFKYGDVIRHLVTPYYEIHPSWQDKTYNVVIYVQVVLSDGRILEGPHYSTERTVKGGVSLTLMLLISFAVLITVVAGLIVAFCVWKKRNPAYLQVVRMEDGSVSLPTGFHTGGSLYVDPKSYADVNDAINEFAYEVDRSDLTTGDMLGSGEFADVFKGTLRRGGKTQDVAVKMLKEDASKADRDDFLSEAVILGQFNDANVIRLEGVVYQDEPNAIILEYMVNGSLDKFLQENDMQFTVEELLEMARGIASGMKCLSEMGFVHRDLAARNILVNAEHHCKIADFGMSLEIKLDDSTEEKVGKIPVRWTAPEAIQFKKFTTASDVWSFGVVLWEIMSYGERPYWDWTNLDVLEKVTSGYRLPPPMGCPRVVHDLMLDCWKKERAKRPLFSTIRNTIFGWLKNPNSLEDVAHSTIELDPNLDYTIMQTINKWLEAIGMGRYTQNFLEQGFATPRQILLLTLDDLEALGVGPKDHQKKIHRAIEMTRSQVEAQIKSKKTNVKADIIANSNFR